MLVGPVVGFEGEAVCGVLDAFLEFVGLGSAMVLVVGVCEMLCFLWEVVSVCGMLCCLWEVDLCLERKWRLEGARRGFK